jgi:hypothetical protein
MRPGRPLVFDQAIYARRNVVERCINRLKQCRGLASRYEKRALNYRAMLVLAAIVLAAIVLAAIVLAAIVLAAIVLAAIVLWLEG